MTQRDEDRLKVKPRLYPNIPWWKLTREQKDHVYREERRLFPYDPMPTDEDDFQQGCRLPRPFKVPNKRPKRKDY